MEEKIYLFDTTLRDGQQTTGVNFSVSDKMILSQHLDELGIDYIEGGWPGANPTDNDYFSKKCSASNIGSLFFFLICLILSFIIDKFSSLLIPKASST